MPILTFCPSTPSGASARAVLAFRKGKKTRFGGAKWRPEKLSTFSTKAASHAVILHTEVQGGSFQVAGKKCANRRSPCKTWQEKRPGLTLRAKGLHKKWCAGQDLNLQGRFVATSTSSWRVCQFHHPRT